MEFEATAVDTLGKILYVPIPPEPVRYPVIVDPLDPLITMVCPIDKNPFVTAVTVNVVAVIDPVKLAKLDVGGL